MNQVNLYLVLLLFNYSFACTIKIASFPPLFTKASLDDVLTVAQLTPDILKSSSSENSCSACVHVMEYAILSKVFGDTENIDTHCFCAHAPPINESFMPPNMKPIWTSFDEYQKHCVETHKILESGGYIHNAASIARSVHTFDDNSLKYQDLIASDLLGEASQYCVPGFIGMPITYPAIKACMRASFCTENETTRDLFLAQRCDSTEADDDLEKQKHNENLPLSNVRDVASMFNHLQETTEQIENKDTFPESGPELSDLKLYSRVLLDHIKSIDIIPHDLVEKFVSQQIIQFGELVSSIRLTGQKSGNFQRLGLDSSVPISSLLSDISNLGSSEDSILSYSIKDYEKTKSEDSEKKAKIAEQMASFRMNDDFRIIYKNPFVTDSKVNHVDAEYPVWPDMDEDLLERSVKHLADAAESRGSYLAQTDDPEFMSLSEISLKATPQTLKSSSEELSSYFKNRFQALKRVRLRPIDFFSAQRVKIEVGQLRSARDRVIRSRIDSIKTPSSHEHDRLLNAFHSNNLSEKDFITLNLDPKIYLQPVETIGHAYLDPLTGEAVAPFYSVEDLSYASRLVSSEKGNIGEFLTEKDIIYGHSLPKIDFFPYFVDEADRLLMESVAPDSIGRSVVRSINDVQIVKIADVALLTMLKEHENPKQNESDDESDKDDDDGDGNYISIPVIKSTSSIDLMFSEKEDADESLDFVSVSEIYFEQLFDLFPLPGLRSEKLRDLDIDTIKSAIRVQKELRTPVSFSETIGIIWMKGVQEWDRLTSTLSNTPLPYGISADEILTPSVRSVIDMAFQIIPRKDGDADTSSLSLDRDLDGSSVGQIFDSFRTNFASRLVPPDHSSQTRLSGHQSLKAVISQNPQIWASVQKKFEKNSRSLTLFPSIRSYKSIISRLNLELKSSCNSILRWAEDFIGRSPTPESAKKTKASEKIIDSDQDSEDIVDDVNTDRSNLVDLNSKKLDNAKVAMSVNVFPSSTVPISIESNSKNVDESSASKLELILFSTPEKIDENNELRSGFGVDLDFKKGISPKSIHHEGVLLFQDWQVQRSSFCSVAAEIVALDQQKFLFKDRLKEDIVSQSDKCYSPSSGGVCLHFCYGDVNPHYVSLFLAEYLNDIFNRKNELKFKINKKKHHPSDSDPLSDLDRISLLQLDIEEEVAWKIYLNVYTELSISHLMTEPEDLLLNDRDRIARIHEIRKSRALEFKKQVDTHFKEFRLNPLDKKHILAILQKYNKRNFITPSGLENLSNEASRCVRKCLTSIPLKVSTNNYDVMSKDGSTSASLYSRALTAGYTLLGKRSFVEMLKDKITGGNYGLTVVQDTLGDLGLSDSSKLGMTLSDIFKGSSATASVNLRVLARNYLNSRTDAMVVEGEIEIPRLNPVFSETDITKFDNKVNNKKENTDIFSDVYKSTSSIKTLNQKEVDAYSPEEDFLLNFGDSSYVETYLNDNNNNGSPNRANSPSISFLQTSLEAFSDPSTLFSGEHNSLLLLDDPTPILLEKIEKQKLKDFEKKPSTEEMSSFIELESSNIWLFSDYEFDSLLDVPKDFESIRLFGNVKEQNAQLQSMQSSIFGNSMSGGIFTSSANAELMGELKDAMRSLVREAPLNTIRAEAGFLEFCKNFHTTQAKSNSDSFFNKMRRFASNIFSSKSSRSNECLKILHEYQASATLNCLRQTGLSYIASNIQSPTRILQDFTDRRLIMTSRALSALQKSRLTENAVLYSAILNVFDNTNPQTSAIYQVLFESFVADSRSSLKNHFKRLAADAAKSKRNREQNDVDGIFNKMMNDLQKEEGEEEEEEDSKIGDSFAFEDAKNLGLDDFIISSPKTKPEASSSTVKVSAEDFIQNSSWAELNTLPVPIECDGAVSRMSTLIPLNILSKDFDTRSLQQRVFDSLGEEAMAEYVRRVRSLLKEDTISPLEPLKENI